jgi:septum formation protein
LSSPLRLVLASRSPQRDLLLRQLGVPFRTVVSAHPEEMLAGPAWRTAEHNAAGKAREVLGRIELAAGELVLGVDTVVVIDGRVLGKADDAAQARAFLRLLAGRRHEVISGLCLCGPGVERAGHAVTTVTFRALDDAAVERYVAGGEWRERAGAYAIQGAGSALVEAVDGDYFNVVGLPVALLVSLLAELGVAPLAWLAAAPPN